MTARAQITFAPRLMQAPVAAAYLGVSTSKFRTLGIPSKSFGGNVVWDRLDLDAFANSLPSSGDPSPEAEGQAKLDRIFGLGE